MERIGKEAVVACSAMAQYSFTVRDNIWDIS
jgi:hypothetical protein